MRNNSIVTLQGAGAPTNGTSGTGAGKAGPGSAYTRRSNGAIYINTNTKASPTWTQLGSVAALTSAHIFVGNGANAATDVALSGDATLANTGAIAIASKLIQHVQVLITNANFKALHTTPLVVLASPGAGKYYVIHDVAASMTYGGSNAFTGGGVVSAVDHGTHNAVHTASGIAAATVNGTASFALQLGGNSTNGGLTRPLATGIDLEAATADFAGNAAADNVGNVDIYYSVVTA